MNIYVLQHIGIHDNGANLIIASNLEEMLNSLKLVVGDKKIIVDPVECAWFRIYSELWDDINEFDLETANSMIDKAISKFAPLDIKIRSDWKKILKEKVKFQWDDSDTDRKYVRMDWVLSEESIKFSRGGDKFYLIDVITPEFLSKSKIPQILL